MFPHSLIDLAGTVIEHCRSRRLTLASAESCTGGLLAGCLTEIPGSSAVVDRAYVSYSNRAKTEMLGVPLALIETHGAVSAEVVKAMTEGVLERSAADLAIAISGIAGPGGGTADKPVGLVHFGLGRRGHGTQARHRHYPGDRSAVRLASVETALSWLIDMAVAEPR